MNIQFDSMDELLAFMATFKTPETKVEETTKDILDDSHIPPLYEIDEKEQVVPEGKEGKIDNGPLGFPVEWKRIAEAFIDKHMIFNTKDIIGSRRGKHNEKAAFVKWVRELPNVDITRDTERIGRPYIFVPFYWENGVKVLASPSPRRKAQIIRGASSFKPVKSDKPTLDEVLDKKLAARR